jgi:thymidine kinase
MAKLYFYYSAMNAGKSTVLLQSSYNYRERGMHTLLLTPEIDTRFEAGTITSRIGLSAQAHVFDQAADLFNLVEVRHRAQAVHCILVDEAQFLSRKQVRQLSDVCDRLDIPVLTYGIRTDFLGNLFEGSMELLAWADSLVEIKTICHCGRKATMQLRVDSRGQPIKHGEQVHIGGNDRYVSVCRVHFKAGLASRRDDELPLDTLF